MAKESILSPEVLRQISTIKSTDILAGIATYNNGTTIGHVLTTVKAGLDRYFPDARAIMVSSDGGSQDETTPVVEDFMSSDQNLLMLSHSPHPLRKILTASSGSTSRSTAYRTFLEIAEILDARACAIFDASSRSMTPEWVELLIRPCLTDGYDFVAPFYLRHKYDGTVTSSIVYPLTRALYGKRIRQPAGDDFGMSGRMVSHFLGKDIWHKALTRHGLDIWLTTTAVAEGYEVCQSFLGPKVSVASEPVLDLSSMLKLVVGAVFGLMETHQDTWASVRGSDPIPVFGYPTDVGLEPVTVNLDRMIGAFKQGMTDLSGVWNSFLPQSLLEGLRRIASLPVPDFRFPDTLWVSTVFEFAIAFHKNKLARDHLIKSIMPLYLGRTASFVLDTQESTAADVENRMELLCLEFETLKPGLTERWRN